MDNTMKLKTPFALLTFKLGSYVDGNTALTASCHDDGYEEPFADVSTNLSVPPSAGCIWAKNWSGNEKIYKFLTENGYLRPTGRTMKTGYVVAHECVIEDKILEFCTIYDKDGNECG